MSLQQKVKGVMGNPDWSVSMDDIRLQKYPVDVLPWTCQTEGKQLS